MRKSEQAIPTKPSLRELQEWMRWAVTDPRGVEPALSDPNPRGKGSRYQAPRVDARDSILAANPSERAERLSIYAEAYFIRILDSLTSDFPSLRRILGENDFTLLVAGYLKAYPSRFFNISEVGRFLPEMLAKAERPWLADLARLEWSLIESFYEPAVPAFDAAKFAADAATYDSAAMRFVFDPACRIFSSDWRVDLLHDSATENATVGAKEGANEVVSESCHLLIHRQNGFAVFRRIEEREAAALNQLLKQPLKQLADGKALERIDGASESDVQTWFSRWTALGLLSKIEFLPALGQS